MVAVGLQWNPSVSQGVTEQQVRICNVDGTVYGWTVLDPTVGSFEANCPNGTTVVGEVLTVRGEDTVLVTSAQLQIPLAPLAGATGLTIGALVASQLPS